IECLPQELIEERHQECLELIDRLAMKKRSELNGSIQEVLIEEDNFGRTRTNCKVHVTGNAAAPAELVRVRITNTQRATLEGVIEDGNLDFENFREENHRASASAGS